MMHKFKLIKAVLHILDRTTAYPILSDNEMELDDSINEFIETHIEKIIFGDDFKICKFNEEESGIFKKASNYEEKDFIEFSKIFARDIYENIKKYDDISSCDLLCASYLEQDTKFFAVLKLNYKESYVHYVEKNNNFTKNNLIVHKAILPNKGQKVDEAIIINMNSFEIKLLEKKVKVDNSKEFYLSSKVLNCYSRISQKSKMNILKNTIENVSDKYFDDDLEKRATFKSSVNRSIEETGGVNVRNIVNEVFENQEIRTEVEKKISKYGIMEDEIVLQNERNTKKFEKHKIKTDTGIEIQVPINLFESKDDVEFINNSDGTISIVLKNINSIKTI